MFQKSGNGPGSNASTVRAFHVSRWPGQVPSQERMEALAATRLATERAPGPNAVLRLPDTTPMMSTDSVVEGLGFDPAERSMWKAFLDDAMNQANEVVVRKTLMSKMLDAKIEPGLKRALFQRSMSLYRNRFQKSLPPEFTITPVEFESARGAPTFHVSEAAIDNRIANLCSVKGISREEFDARAQAYDSNKVQPLRKSVPDSVLREICDLTKEMQAALDAEDVPRLREAARKLSLQKAGAHGGNYYRRTTNEQGKHRYFYKPEDYDKSKGAHVDGEAQAHKQISEHVAAGVQGSGKQGYHVKGLKPLVKRYGSKRVGDSLKEQCADGGSLSFKGGRFYASQQPAEKKA